MPKFYCNKFPLMIGTDENNKPILLPEGTAFTVVSVWGDSVHLNTLKKTEVKNPNLYGYPGCTGVSVGVLNFAFTENDTID